MILVLEKRTERKIYKRDPNINVDLFKVVETSGDLFRHRRLRWLS